MSGIVDKIWARRETMEKGDTWIQCHTGHGTLMAKTDVPYVRETAKRAAAADMLAALKEIMEEALGAQEGLDEEHMDLSGYLEAIEGAAQAAIAKAEGTDA